MANDNDPQQTESQSQEGLSSLLSGNLNDAATIQFEKTLGSNESLRKQLDDLSGLTELSGEMKQLGAVSSPHSDALKKAIQALLRDGVSLIDRAAALIDVEIDSDNIILKRPIGSGAMGVVYEGYDQHLGRAVAVKLLSSNWKDNPAAKERLVREAQAAAQLQHENVVAIHSIHPLGDRPYIVQQFVAGESLQKRINRVGRLPLDEVQSLAIQLAKGLSAAHRCGLVHRDLKPDNILIENETGIVRIADFGLVKRQGSEQMTQEGVIAGTPAYMSPEQTRGESLDARSDLFSLGLVLYRVATGKQPFEGDDPYVVMDQIRNRTPTSLTMLVPELPTTWIAAVDKLMAKERDARFATASQFLEVIHPETRSPIDPSVGTIPRSNKKRTFLLGGLIGAGCISFGAFGLWQLWDATQSSGDNASPVNVLPMPGAMVPFTGKESKGVVAESVAFQASNNSRRFLKLSDAVEAADDGATILVFGTGTVVTESIRITGKSLKIIATPSARVILRANDLPAGIKEPLISSDRDLLLSGLTIESSRTGSVTLELPVQSILHNKGGKLTMDRCKIEATLRCICIVSLGGDVVINNSTILSAEGLVFGSTHPNVSLKVQNSFLDSRDCFDFIAGDGIGLDTLTEGKADGTIILDHVSISAACAFRFGLTRVAKRPIRIALSNCVLDCESVVELFTKTPNRIDLLTPDGMVKNMDELMMWTEDRCILRKGTQFLSSFVAKRQGKKFQPPFRTWDDWSDHWKLARKTSIQSQLRRSKEASHSVFYLEELPQDFQECGADMAKIPLR